MVTLGTPYRGSVEALVKLLTGMANLAGEVPEEREREAARSMPGVYQLLPSFEGAVISEETGEDAGALLFRTEGWQPGILQSLAEYIRLHAVDAGNDASRKDRAQRLLQEFLDVSRQQRGRMETLDIGAGGLSTEDWLVVVGAGARTRVRARLGKHLGQPRYGIHDEDFVDNHWDDRESIETGDSTVPLQGALPSFVAPEQIVAVTPRDFGFGEVKDRTLHGVAGFHALLPNLNLAQRLALRHLRGRAYRGEVWGQPIPGVPDQDWDPPIPGLDLRRRQ